MRMTPLRCGRTTPVLFRWIFFAAIQSSGRQCFWRKVNRLDSTRLDLTDSSENPLTRCDIAHRPVPKSSVDHPPKLMRRTKCRECPHHQSDQHKGLLQLLPLQRLSCLEDAQTHTVVSKNSRCTVAKIGNSWRSGRTDIDREAPS
jgi:hypothetical protein